MNNIEAQSYLNTLFEVILSGSVCASAILRWEGQCPKARVTWRAVIWLQNEQVPGWMEELIISWSKLFRPLQIQEENLALCWILILIQRVNDGLELVASTENLKQPHIGSMAICWNCDEKWKLQWDSNFPEDPMVTEK